MLVSRLSFLVCRLIAAKCLAHRTRNEQRETTNELRLSFRIRVDCVEVVANYRAHLQRHLTPLDRPFGRAAILGICRSISRSGRSRSWRSLQVEVLSASPTLGFATQLLF